MVYVELQLEENGEITAVLYDANDEIIGFRDFSSITAAEKFVREQGWKYTHEISRFYFN